MPNKYLLHAISYVKEKYGNDIRIEDTYETETYLPLTDKRFWSGKIFTKEESYNIYIEKETDKIYDSIASFFIDEKKLRKDTYGKFDQQLYEKLQTLNDDDLIEVSIWLKYDNEEKIIDEVKQHFNAIAFNGDIPNTQDYSLNDEIFHYKYELMSKDIEKIEKPFLDKLKRKNINILCGTLSVPNIYVSTTKSELLGLQNIDEIDFIYESEICEEQDSAAISTTKVYDMLNRGYNGGASNIINTTQNKVVEILVDVLNVRKEPSTSNAIIAKAYKGEFYPIVRWDASDWCEININRDTTGWISMSGNVNAVGRFPGTGKIVRTNHLVSIYKEANTNSTVLYVVNINTELIELERGTTMTRVLNPIGVTGWVLNTSVTQMTTGYSPTGRTAKIAVLERQGVDFTNPYLKNANGGTYNTNQAVFGEHQTMVAGCIASIERGAKGHAPGSVILNANAKSLDFYNIKPACMWAIKNGANIINCSFGSIDYPTGSRFNDTTKFLDYIARNYNITVVVAAGNIQTSNGILHTEIKRPAIGYNVLAVGNIDDSNTGDRFDDSLSTTTCTVNPVSPHKDRHKPELSAPGTNIMTTLPMSYKPDANTPDITSPGYTSYGNDKSGTSLSAPVVAGIAAILQELCADAYHSQVLTRAILIASATHEVTSAAKTGHWALGEGTGTIDVSVMRNLVINGWYASTIWYQGLVIKTYSTPLRSGQKIKGVIVWDAHSISESVDELSYDLDLQLFDNNGNRLDLSATYDNTVEIVEYTATRDMDVTFRITSNNNPVVDRESLAIAWSIQ